MRLLTPEEQSAVEERRRQLDQIMREMEPMLREFADLLKLRHAAKIFVAPDEFLHPISEWLSRQAVENDQISWIGARIGCLIGLVINSRLNGGWFVNDSPDTRYFRHIVIGRFTVPSKQNAMFDPFEAAHIFLLQPPGRSLLKFVKKIESECIDNM